MKIGELIKYLEQFNPDGEIVMVYDCSRAKLNSDDISVYNGTMPFQGDTFTPSEEEVKNLSDRDCYYTSWALIIENK